MGICHNGGIIFVGNTTVLLIIALTTDYWEYRGINRDQVIKEIETNNWKTHVVLPFDTNSYIQIRTISNKTENRTFENSDDCVDTCFSYHAPVFVVKHSMSNTASDYNSDDNGLVMPRTANFNASNVIWQHEINLFNQYGNLFRDCDDVEEVVRARIGLNFSRPRNCLYVLFSEDSKNDELQHASELAFLKSMACACAVGCIVLVGAAFVTGWHATFLRFPNTRLFHIASIMSLSAGFLLTIGIALFHGRCYVLRKMELFPGQDVPFKDLIHRSKVYSYGWSFDLAWLCVACSYISAYIWLRKGHGTRRTIANADTTLSRATQKKVTCLVNWKPHKTMSPTTIATI